MCKSRTFLISIATVFLTILPLTAIAAQPSEKLLSAGHIDEAITEFRTRINANTNDAEAHNLLCRANLTLGNLDDAVAACQKAAALQPAVSRYHLWLGRAYGEKAENSIFLSALGLA